MINSFVFAAAAMVFTTASIADDGRGLRRGAKPADVTISGVSSGAAMAVQYAIAHSGSIVGVGAIAGPGWGCADGKVTTAVNDCMCGRAPVASRIDLARSLQSAPGSRIDKPPMALRRAYVFHSRSDETVNPDSGKAAIEFLAGFLPDPPTVDWGNPGDGSDQAGHGIISPDGTDSCKPDARRDRTYVRKCGGADNAGKLLHALYGKTGSSHDSSKRVKHIPATEVWKFDQQRLIDDAQSGHSIIASDRLLYSYIPYQSERRKNYDMAGTGYLYVPPSCRQAGNSECRVHVALHGCKQDARTFAVQAGYNNWADYYKVIVIYPAIARGAPVSGSMCALGALPPVLDSAWFEPNPNGCWDWWGYLDAGNDNRYLTRQAPQIQVLQRIIAAATAPVR